MENHEKAILLFDGFCNLCNASVNFIIDHDPSGYFLFTSIQSEAGQKIIRDHGINLTKNDSLILLEKGTAYLRSDASLRIAGKLKGGWKLLTGLVVFPRFIRDPVYNWIARNRYKWFGKREACRIPEPGIRNRFLS